MRYYAGLDVSSKEVAVCVMDHEGEIHLQAKIPCEIENIKNLLDGTGLEIVKIGMESGSLSQWLTKGLREEGFSVVIMESRKMAAILATLINKTDENDARGIAEALRAGHYQDCVQRSDEAIEVKTILHCRETVVKQKTHLTNSLRGHLKQYGIRLGSGSGKDFEERVKEAIKNLPERSKKPIKSLLKIFKVLEKQLEELDKQVQIASKGDDDIKLLKSIDGVGDITALAFKYEIENPRRFEKSRNVAAYLGLTPSQYSSGETQRQGKISKKGSKHVRYLLVEAATVLLTRCNARSRLWAWGMKLIKKKGKRKAIVAVARKLAVMMHSMLLSRKKFERSNKSPEKIAA